MRGCDCDCGCADGQNLDDCMFCSRGQHAWATPPGWYDDPEHDGYLRWWSGSAWAGDPIAPEYVG